MGLLHVVLKSVVLVVKSDIISMELGLTGTGSILRKVR
jgi:hypothetical protein